MAVIQMDKNGYGKGYDPYCWPLVRGEYVVGDPEGRVAIVTLASLISMMGAAISGPCKTENLGVEKIIANVISNSNIRFVLVCGSESRGHLPGDALLALHRNGIDEAGRIVGARGAIPFIQNLPLEAVKRFQQQVEVIDRIGLEDTAEIELLIRDYSGRAGPYPEKPFIVFKKHARQEGPRAEGGDVMLGPRTVLNTLAWLVLSEKYTGDNALADGTGSGAGGRDVQV